MDSSVKKELEALAEKGAAEDNVLINGVPGKALEVLVHFWPFLKHVLTVVRIFTGKKGDTAIEKIIEAGDLLAASIDVFKS